MSEPISAPLTPAPAGRAAWLVEAEALARLAAPIVATQLAWVGMMATDVLMIGRLGATALAGASLTFVFFFLAFVVAVGIVMATAGLASQAVGARQPRMVRRTIRQGLWVVITLSVPALVLLWFAGPAMRLSDQPPEAVAVAEIYLSALMWSFPFAIAQFVLRNFFAALDRPAPAMWVMLAGIPLNALLDYALIFGHFGLPRLEMLGAGLATTLINVVMFAAMLALAVTMRPFRRYAILGRFWRPDWQQYGRIWRIGLPIGASMFLEAGLFLASIFLMGLIGTLPLAAFMIAMQIPHVSFMVPLGLSQAATVRVGHAAGRRDPAGAALSGWTALVMGVGVTAVTSLIALLLPGTLAGLFVGPEAEDGAALLALATGYVIFAAGLQMFDGIQVVMMGALRGLNDTAVPMGMAIVAYWAVGMTACLYLAFEAGWEGAGIWTGFILALGVASALLIARWRQLMRQRYLPPVQATVPA